MIKATIIGAENLARDIKREEKRARYAMNVAVRVEGFRQMRQLKKEIRAGAPGGKRLAPLSVIARKIYHRGRNEPLRRLALGVRYYVPKLDPVEMHVGWTDPQVSTRWKYLAKVLQEGFTRRVTDDFREYLSSYGGDLRDRRARQVFFLRQDTKRFETPARPIMEPFWRAQEDEARRNIVENFRRKMRGERI